MVGGFNDNVIYRGRTFHVQTERSSRGGSQIVALVYEGGTIVHADRHGDVQVEDPDARTLTTQIGQRHRQLIRALRAGELDGELGIESGPESDRAPAAPLPESPRRESRPGREFGAGVVSRVRLDEWIVARIVAC